MPATNRPDSFAYRVNFAASVISSGRATTRNFDNCFENWDGDAVAVALYRRARKNPKLRAALWRYIGRATVLPIVYQERRRTNLKAWAAELRADAKAKSDAFFAARK
jgi:hypothetical protein